MHEDGLADSADGLWGDWEKERRLEIMKDSTIGVYGVVALIFALLFRLLLVSHLFDLSVALVALLIAGSFSRAVLAVIMVQLPSA
jgi:adenosylcobinamide-GDP ribazoletransferase